MIELVNLKKSFGPNLVWQNVNVTIQDGERLAIIGRSGCGKSVLLKHINALLYPDEGEVLIDGKNIYTMNYVDLRKTRQQFGVLFQGAALFDSISAFENVAFPLRFFRRTMTEAEIKDAVQHCLELVNLPTIGSKSTAELSGGMRKRVGLARAIIMEPKYVLYDEPTSGLDPVTSDEINKLINRLAEELKITSVIISHDMHSVMEVSDKVLFLDNQKVSFHGTLKEMKSSDNEELRTFITASEYQIN